MIKKICITILLMIVLVPVCGLLGYAIGYGIAPFTFSDQLHPDFYEQDRELIAGIYGIMFIGGALYLLSLIAILIVWLKPMFRSR
ncbi:hypothetical protein H7Q97_15060 [Ochrobactrum sp. CM-21-5]|nr:hypothetical protein [Ochrobactrum sp. CM-21-5]MBC2886710.1 hypothetical protein [Ochrobactrum sp. CM-21-5]